MTRLAVVLFNLGGPDSPDAIRPFLFNLFNDKAIIPAPGPIRWWIAHRISKKRAPVAAEIYEHLGGKSPLLDLTNDQAAALQTALGDAADEVKTFVCMRYWHPMSDQVTREVKAYDPDRVILLPLYPQYSTTTTGSSLTDWHKAARKAGLTAPSTTLCCYPTDANIIAGLADLVSQGIEKAGQYGSPRVLFSAHGLPEDVIEGGDPYQFHVEQTARAVAGEIQTRGDDDLDWVVCYQSRVGPKKWIGPSTDAEIARAGLDGVPVVVVPIAFVSEHSETLVELDIEYKELAEENGVPGYVRVPALGTNEKFIAGLAGLVRHALTGGALCSQGSGRVCPDALTRCPHTG